MKILEKIEEEEEGFLLWIKAAIINHKIALEPCGWGILHLCQDKDNLFVFPILLVDLFSLGETGTTSQGAFGKFPPAWQKGWFSHYEHTFPL